MSPIRKKSLSSSSLLDDLSSTGQAADTTTVSNGTNNATPTNNNNNNSKSFISEENKENDITSSAASNQKLDENGCPVVASELNGTETKQNTETDATETAQIDNEKKIKKKSSSKCTAKQQLERFISGWVNQKKTGKFNKKDVKNLAKISNTLIKTKGAENGAEEEDEEESEELDEEGFILFNLSFFWFEFFL